MQLDFASTPNRSLETERARTEVNEFLWKVYRWMSAGLGLTGITARVVASSPTALRA